MLFYLVAAILVSGLLVAAGWLYRRRVHQSADPVPLDRRSDEPRFGQTQFAGDLLDVAEELAAVLARLREQAAYHLVRAELAVQPHLTVHVDPVTFRHVLTDVIAGAVSSAPGGKVLVSAKRLGAMVHIAASDDGQDTDQARRESELRSVIGLVALHGGGVEIDARKGEGTTVVIRLPVAPKLATVPQADNEPAQPVEAAPRQVQPVRLA
jgi:signal transduction histidine kinase